MQKIKPEDMRVERLNVRHSAAIMHFRSYERELVDFLREDALDNQEKMISVTYLWFLKDNDDLVGYITLLNDKINLISRLKELFCDKGIVYSTLPSLKIGRLAVDDRYLRRGIGSTMIFHAISKAQYTFLNISGCRFLSLDAKRNGDSISFYKKLGFFTTKENTTLMYLDLQDAIS